MTPVWRKSSRSGSGQGGQSDCVEVAKLTGGVGLRDSKASNAEHLSITTKAFADLLTRLKQDDLTP